ncbi:MAG: thiol reductant ABC exporter subunit CydC [Lawsonella sp.]
MKELKLAFRLLQMNRWRILLAVIMGSFTLLAALGLAGLSAWLIARTWQKPLVASITLAVTAVRGLGVSRGAFRYFDRLASHNVALGGLVNARENIYNYLADGDPSVVLKMRKGDFLARLGSDVDDVGDLIVRAIIPAFVAVVLDVVAVVWMAILSPWAGVIMAVALLIAGVLVPWLSARAAVAAEESKSEADHDLYSDAVTIVDHAPELAVGGRLEGVLESAEEAGERSLQEEDKSAIPNAVASAIGPVATWVTVLACLLIGIVLYAQNGMGVTVTETTMMQPTTLLVMALLPLSAFEASDQLPAAAVQYVRSRASLRRIRELLTPSREKSGTPVPTYASPGVPAVTAENLTCGWHGKPIIKPIDFAVEPGERLIVVGPSGIGKTTLLSTLAGLIPPTGGVATINGVETSEAQEESLRRAVAAFPEDAHIFDTTVLENLHVIKPDLDEAGATEVLQKVGLGEWLDNLDRGVNTKLVGGADAVSGGERRRLLLARAVIAARPVTLLDEPTEHLDAADMKVMLNRILEPGDLFDPNQAVVVVTHVVPENLPAGVRVVELEPTEDRRLMLL